MKKEAKVEFGITITKPWSSEMYAHNEEVAAIVQNEIENRIIAVVIELEAECGSNYEMIELDWISAPEALKDIQTAITAYGFGYGYTVGSVLERMYDELENAPLYRLNEMVEELGIELEKGFVGFN